MLFELLRVCSFVNKVYILFKFRYKLSAMIFTRLNSKNTNNVEKLAEGIKNHAEITIIVD